MKLQRLTITGMNDLERELLRVQNEANPTLDIDKFKTEPTKDIKINPNKIFKSKLELGKYLLTIFDNNHIEPNARIWGWLFLLYQKQFWNKYGKIGEVKRVFYSTEETYSYTHVLVPIYDICKFYKNDMEQIAFLLSEPINESGGIYLNTVKKQDRMKNINFINVAKRLFYDNKKKQFKRGREDGMDRLIELYNQYERGFDMYRMPSDYFINKIIRRKHKELRKFL